MLSLPYIWNGPKVKKKPESTEGSTNTTILTSMKMYGTNTRRPSFREQTPRVRLGIYGMYATAIGQNELKISNSKKDFSRVGKFLFPLISS